eukprot:COSAG04_NODE_254_length_18809_cov_8.025869_24_plen_272_part_00
MPAHEPIEFVPGDFEYNARVAALLGPCWAIMLMFGGKTTTGALARPSLYSVPAVCDARAACRRLCSLPLPPTDGLPPAGVLCTAGILVIGLIIAYMFDLSNVREGSLIVLWITMLAVGMALFVLTAILLYNNFYLLFLLGVMDILVFLTGAWATLQFRWLQRDSPAMGAPVIPPRSFSLPPFARTFPVRDANPCGRGRSRSAGAGEAGARRAPHPGVDPAHLGRGLRLRIRRRALPALGVHRRRDCARGRAAAFLLPPAGNAPPAPSTSAA